MDDNECTVREQDRFMPIANVIRIMRKTLPPHAKISDDAKETIQECVSEYISFVTSEANERCQKEQRKTITAEDVLWAMAKLGFEDYIDPITLYLNRYREIEGDRLPIRGDPIMKRPTTDQFGGICIPNFGAAFDMGHPHLPAGFFGGAPVCRGSSNNGAGAAAGESGGGSSQHAAVGVAALHQPHYHHFK